MIVGGALTRPMSEPVARYLRWYILGRTVSIAGDRIADVAIPIAVLAATGSAADAALVGGSIQLPSLLLSLPAGVLADRADRRLLLVSTDGVRVLLVVAFAAAMLLLQSPLWILCALGFLIGTADIVHLISASAALPMVAPKGRLVQANVALEVGDATATSAGPAIGGFIIQRAGLLTAFLCNAATFLASLACLGQLPPLPVADGPRPSRALRGVVSDALGGVRHILRSRVQLVLQAGLMAANLLSGALVLLVVLHAQRTLGASAAETGIIVGAAGVGGAIGALGVTRYVRRLPWTLATALALGIAGAAALALSQAQSVAVAAVANGVLDCGLTVAFVLLSSLRQAATPAAVLGRVLSASSLTNAAARLLGVGAVGTLPQLLTVPMTVAAFGGVMGAVAIFLAAAPVPRALIEDIEAEPLADQ